ncbi:MAG TPA: META domain-containing protein [Candidatus Limnocylindria bacterium]|nr:META domain-containing protein [Candidatus Limnocylindria bacterium]
MLAIFLTACGAPDGSVTTGPNADPTGAWQFIVGRSGDEELPVLGDPPITLSLSPSEIGGTAGCNSYGASLSREGGGIRLGPIDRTLRGCEAAAEAAAERYLTALATVTDVRVQEDELVLRRPDAELRFERIPDAPTVDLVGTSWTLTTLIDGEANSAAAGAFLQLRPDGTFRGSTGCRTFEGTYIRDRNRILATAVDLIGGPCKPEMVEQDGHVVTVIGPNLSRRLTGDC